MEPTQAEQPDAGAAGGSNANGAQDAGGSSQPQAAEPYVVECLEGTPGPARWSDGTMRYSDWCFYQNGGPAYVEAESQSGLDPSEIPAAEGGTCAAAICGYGTDENGNPNPSSGELQTMDGCEQGYITDPELCAAVQQKAEQYGW